MDISSCLNGLSLTGGVITGMIQLWVQLRRGEHSSGSSSPLRNDGDTLALVGDMSTGVVKVKDIGVIPLTDHLMLRRISRRSLIKPI